MKIPAVTIHLEPEQSAAARPVIDKAHAAFDAGEPGMVLAQVFGPHMKVFFVPKAVAEELQRLMGSPVGMLGGPNPSSTEH